MRSIAPPQDHPVATGSLATIDRASQMLAEASSLQDIKDFAVFLGDEPDPIALRWNTPPDSMLAAYRIADTSDGFVVKSWPYEWANGLRGGRLRSRICEVPR